MSGWRYLAQNKVTGEWLSTDLELRDVEVEIALSGPGGITGSIAPELVAAMTPDGRGRRFNEWQTAIYAEDPAHRLYAGLLVRSESEDESNRWSIECPGFSSYPHGMVVEADWGVWRPDAFEPVRQIWADLQSREDGDLGMIVTSENAGVQIGDFQPPPRPTSVTTVLVVPTKGPMPVQGPSESELDYLARVEAWEDTYASNLAIYKAAVDAEDTAAAELGAAKAEWDAQYGDRKFYRLAWWENTDAGEEIDRLATEVPFEYMERHEWLDPDDPDDMQVRHYLDLYHPMVGTRRHDLRFAVGENVAVIPPPEYDGDLFASDVLALGKGDGRAMLRSNVSVRTGRLRRTSVLAVKDVGNAARLRALAEDELRKREAYADVTELLVFDHPNAPFGSWTTGDEVFIGAGGEGWFHEDMWVRIVSTRIRPDESGIIRLSVVNTERVVS